MSYVFAARPDIKTLTYFGWAGKVLSPDNEDPYPVFWRVCMEQELILMSWDDMIYITSKYERFHEE